MPPEPYVSVCGLDGRLLLPGIKTPSSLAALSTASASTLKAVELSKLRALEPHYDLFTRVKGDMKPGFPSVLLLESSLVTIFGWKKPMLPSSCDQATVAFRFTTLSCCPALIPIATALRG